MLCNSIRNLAAAFSVVLIASAASADSLNPRPLDIDLSVLKAGFDTLATDGDYGIDLKLDQIGSAFARITGNGLGSASLVAAISGAMPDDSLFGFYKNIDPSKRLTLFDSDVDRPQIVFQFKDLDHDGSIDARAFEPGEAAFDTVHDFGVRFGFFLTVGQTTWFSEDSLNGDSAQMLIYPSNDTENIDLGIPFVAPGPDTAHFYVAAEQTWTGNVSGDFTDVVVQFESITPTPEPGSMILVLAGLSGAFAARRRAKRKSA